ncbi:MAG: hypothetical protein ACRDOZ_09330 [Nocardioides sp.]
MNFKSMLVAGAATFAGVAGGVAVYQVTAPAEVEHGAAPEAVAATPKARAANGETRYAPCRPPSVLEGGKCVTTQVQTVTVPAPAAPAPEAASAPEAAAPAAPAPQAAAPAPATPAAPAQPAQQPGGHTAGGAHVDYEDSDCQKWHEGDADDPEEAQDDYEDCMEDSAEEREDAREDSRDDAEDARDD